VLDLHWPASSPRHHVDLSPSPSRVRPRLYANHFYSTARYMGRLDVDRGRTSTPGLILGIITDWLGQADAGQIRRSLRYGPVAGMALVSVAGPCPTWDGAGLCRLWRLASPY